MENAGQRIASMRKERGWTQAELAGRLGVSRQQVMRYEAHGIATMRTARLAAMCREFGCSSDRILFGEDAKLRLTVDEEALKRAVEPPKEEVT